MELNNYSLESHISDCVEQVIKERIDEEIEKRVEQFRRELTYKKDQYLGEILSGIRMYTENNLGEITYKVIFENVVKVEK